MVIVVSRDQADLFEHFRWGFVGIRGVEVVLDRRLGRRRERPESARSERRPGDPRTMERRGRDRRRGATVGELRARGFAIVPSTRDGWIDVRGRQADPGAAPAESPGAPARRDLPDPSSFERRQASGLLPSDPEPEELPVDRAREGRDLDALGSRLLERATVVFERDGRREAGTLVDVRTGVWRCGHCRRGTVMPGPDEFLPRKGRLCPLCRAAIVVTRVRHPDERPLSFWRRLVGWGRPPGG